MITLRDGIVSTVALVLACASATAASAGPLEGRWLLVEQTIGSGRANHVDPAAPVRVEFVHQDGRLVGRTWVGDAREGVSDWPSPPAGEGAAVRVEEVVIAPAEDRVLARYRTEPSPGEETIPGI